MSEIETEKQVEKPKTSKPAVLSFICAILGLLFLFFISLCLLYPDEFIVFAFTLGLFPILAASGLGLIFGIIATIIIKCKREFLTGRNWSTGGICLALIGFLVLYVFWVRVTPIADKVMCAANLRNINIALVAYIDDNDGKYPTPSKWCDLLVQYANADPNRFGPTSSFGRHFVCPGAREGRCHYAINPNAKINSPHNTVRLFETNDGWNQFGGPELLTIENHGGKGCNIVFNDGHVKFVKPRQLAELKWEDDQNNN